jgi:hypothetical protein
LVAAPLIETGEPKPANSPIEQTIIDMAETMGRLVGEGEVRWKQWITEPNTVRDNLMTIRDKATHLLLEMRTSAMSGFAQRRDEDDGDVARVNPQRPVTKGKPTRAGR